MKNILESWFRTVVPKGFATATIRIDGTSPLLMNSPEADRDGELYRAFYLLGQKVGKSLEDEARLREMEWELRLYLDADLGPYVPGRVVKKTLIDAAGKFKKGATVKRSLITQNYRIPLEYDGPRDQQGLWDEGYRYTTMVKNNGFNAGRVMRCRPMFPQWALTVPIAFDPEEVDPDTLALIVERSQRYGLLDYRPGESGGDFGQFAASIEFNTPVRASRNGNAIKKRDKREEDAHAAAVRTLSPTR